MIKFIICDLDVVSCFVSEIGVFQLLIHCIYRLNYRTSLLTCLSILCCFLYLSVSFHVRSLTLLRLKKLLKKLLSY